MVAHPMQENVGADPWTDPNIFIIPKGKENVKKKFAFLIEICILNNFFDCISSNIPSCKNPIPVLYYNQKG